MAQSSNGACWPARRVCCGCGVRALAFPCVLRWCRRGCGCGAACASLAIARRSSSDTDAAADASPATSSSDTDTSPARGHGGLAATVATMDRRRRACAESVAVAVTDLVSNTCGSSSDFETSAHARALSRLRVGGHSTPPVPRMRGRRCHEPFGSPDGRHGSCKGRWGRRGRGDHWSGAADAAAAPYALPAAATRLLCEVPLLGARRWQNAHVAWMCRTSFKRNPDNTALPVN